MANTIESVPVGTILPYAGNLNNNALNELGWSICDGAELKINDYSGLYKVIGSVNGGDGISYFNIPDYQGRFLRCTDTSGKIDKGATERTAAASGGATGAQVGTIEGAATALPTTPKSPFTAEVAHVPSSSSHNAYSGSNADMLKDNATGTFKSNAGGDDQTCPINAYVNFIIKISDSAAIPTGTIIHYMGPSNLKNKVLSKHYLFCDGHSLSNSSSTYTLLYKAIGDAHGGDKTNFNLPDYRGRFLRGVDNGTQRDPGVVKRTAMATGGVIGDSTGSIQGYATAKPVAPFYIELTYGTDHKESDHCDGHGNSAYNKDGVTQSLTAKGGDSETRPVNVYVDNYIFIEEDNQQSDIFPIGAIIGIAGPTNPGDNWLACNGSLVSNELQYQALYEVLGHSWGGSGNNFNIPALAGMFLRGRDDGTKRDPDTSTRTATNAGGNTGDAVGSEQGYATARPTSADITTSIDHLPTEEYDNALAIFCSSVDAWNSGKSTYTVKGGDAETRPINANINYFIKIATVT